MIDTIFFQKQGTFSEKTETLIFRYLQDSDKSGNEDMA